MAGQRLSCKRTQHNESRAREREGHGEVKMRAGGVKDEPEADWLRTGVVCHVWMWTLLLTSTYLHLPAVHLPAGVHPAVDSSTNNSSIFHNAHTHDRRQHWESLH